jgi:indolepyruvate ferredoxin oxidoreductase
MAMWMGRNVVMGTHMGAEGAQWIGMTPFTETEHIFQNMGDGTYFHSGNLAVKYAASTGVNITYKLLYNAHTSMTGGQEVMGSHPVANVTADLLANGVKRVIITSDEPEKYAQVTLPGGTEVWHRDRLIEAQQVLAGIKGTTVLIHDQECAAELRRMRGRGKRVDPVKRVIINERVCEGCGDCGASANCMSVEPVQTEYGRKTRIHQPSCNKDYSCVQGFCPSFITVTPADDGEAPKKKQKGRMPALERQVPEPVFKVQGDFGVHVMGIGGTGTVTVAAIIANAARIDGKFAIGLDQTGLAQKGGAVISDIKVSVAPFDGSNKISDGSADLYLGFDILNATDPKNLDKCHPARTIAVVSTTESPTGYMITNKNVLFPQVSGLTHGIDRVTRRADNIYLDAQALAEGLFADNMATNTFMLGVAYQAGALPISGSAIEAAIRQAGVGVDMGLLAFAWGRMAVTDRDFVVAQIHKLEGDEPVVPVVSGEAKAIIKATGADGEVKRLLDIRVPELIAYQDEKYASKYAKHVAQVIQAERRVAPGQSALGEAVARNLYKLMAYKDEYEVARLQSDPAFLEKLKLQFKPGFKVQYHLAPPLLADRDPVTGELRKRVYGAWVLTAFKLLAKLKGLRGGTFDVFGKTEERREERQLIEDYIRDIHEVLGKLGPENHVQAVALANVPDMIRGYGHVKAKNLEAARVAGAKCQAAFRNPVAATTEMTAAA